jgi:hypothetical protein
VLTQRPKREYHQRGEKEYQHQGPRGGSIALTRELGWIVLAKKNQVEPCSHLRSWDRFRSTTFCNTSSS